MSEPINRNGVLVPVPSEAVLIRRANNGWVLTLIKPEDNIVVEKLFEDQDESEPWHEIESLVDLLWDAFPEYVVTNYAGGLNIEVSIKPLTDESLESTEPTGNC